jgi:hypothetical protein
LLHLIYKDKCLFVCMELIQIHISEPIWTRLRTRLPLGLEEVVGYVWTRNSWPLRPFRLSFFRGQCRIVGTRWLPARPFSVIPLYPWIPKRVRVTSYGWCPAPPPRSSRQRFVRYSGTCSCDVTHTTLSRQLGIFALCVMHRKRGKDNTHACKRGILMTLGGWLIMFCYCIPSCTHNNNSNVYPT